MKIKMISETQIKIRKPEVLWKQWVFIKRELELTKVFTFAFSMRIWSFKWYAARSGWNYSSQTLYNSETDIDGLQGGIAAGSFCRHILMIQFLRWTSSTSVTHTTFQTYWMILKLIIYESFWSKLLGLSQKRFILFNPSFLAVCSVDLISFC